MTVRPCFVKKSAVIGSRESGASGCFFIIILLVVMFVVLARSVGGFLPLFSFLTIMLF